MRETLEPKDVFLHEQCLGISFFSVSSWAPWLKILVAANGCSGIPVRVKDHLFYNPQILDRGISRFDADPLIANHWLQMQDGYVSDHATQLMRHELFEATFTRIFKTDYRTAHGATVRAGRPSGLE